MQVLVKERICREKRVAQRKQGSISWCAAEGLVMKSQIVLSEKTI